MITSFREFLITENPDTLYTDGETYHYGMKDAVPFEAGVIDGEVKNVYIGESGGEHADNIKVREGEEEAYPGRLWLKGKIMSFWVYPDEKTFRKIVSGLEELLGVRIFNNGWQLEVIDKDGEIKKSDKDDDLYYSKYGGEDYNEIIPLDYYTGSNDVPEEVRLRHTMNWKEKEAMRKSGKFKGSKFGSSKTAWDQPRNLRYRQALYQESKK
jgi:hypothetical protein